MAISVMLQTSEEGRVAGQEFDTRRLCLDDWLIAAFHLFMKGLRQKNDCKTIIKIGLRPSLIKLTFNAFSSPNDFSINSTSASSRRRQLSSLGLQSKLEPERVINLGSANTANHFTNIFEICRVRRSGLYFVLLTSVGPERLHCSRQDSGVRVAPELRVGG